MLYRFGCPVLARANRLPSSAAALEVAECLSKLEGLDDNALLLLIVSQLGVTRQGEIFAQWVAIKTVIGHDATEIRVTREKDTEHIVDLTLVPQGTLKQTSHTGYWGRLVRIRLDADARVVPHTEHVVNHLETLVAGREINAGNVGDLRKLGGRVILEEAHDRDHTSWRGVDGELILPDRELLDVLGQAGHDVLPIVVQTVRLVLVLVVRVDNRGAQGSLGYTRAIKSVSFDLAASIQGN